MTWINGLLITALAFFIVFPSESGLCLWPNVPEQNVPVCVAEDVQEFPVLVEDGSGGVIVAWHDIRSGNRDVYAQRINADGEVLWAKDGIPVYTGKGEQGWPIAVSDGTGGAIIAWMDSRYSIQDIYAQRVDANGKLLWDAAGVPVCVDDVLQEDVMAIADGSGGVFLTWEDWRNGNQDLYTQHLNADGKPVWAKNGVPACKAEGDQYDPSVTTDGKGGAIFAWWDISSPDWNIRAQHLDVNGNPVWGESGVAVCDEPGAQGNPFIVSDGAGGAYVIWVDYRKDEMMMFANGDIYVQHLDANGTLLWPKGGIPLCDLPSNQQQPAIISDGTGGAIITWWDERDVYSDIYVQRIKGTRLPKADVSGNGKMLWQANGLPVCVAEGLQREPQLISDGAGGAIIYWNDYRRDYGEQTADDIYVQRLNATGEILWGHNGAAVCTADGPQITPYAAAAGEGGIFIAWTDKRNGEEDIYIQRISFK
ncbi:hypothetical protein FJZ31_22500 [Candidatus Poribacteria bacterium]|nr:hypothetical protein [Candidatus Poribacteria bacterium]